MMVCLSHQGTLNIMDIIAEGHSEKVDAWKDSLESYSNIPVLLPQYVSIN